MKFHIELVSCQLGDGHAKFCALKLMPFASSVRERFVTLHGPVENDEFSKEKVCVLGDMHENVEALHRSIQKQTDEATKSWEALSDALTNNPGFLGTVASWKTFQYAEGELQPFNEQLGKPSDSHLPWMCMLRCGSQRNFQKMQVPMPGFAVVLRSDTSLLVHAMPVQSFLNLGIAISAVAQFLESADGQDFMEKHSVLLKYNGGDHVYVP